MQSNDRDENFAGARQQDLIRLLDSLTLASERAEKEIAELEETRRSLITDTDSNNAALEQAREQAAALSILAGTVPAVGQGVVVSVRDPAGGVGIDQMLNGLEELRDAGAEAIEINNTVRVVAQTALEDGEGGVVIDGQQLSSPYRIEVIGEPNTLAQALDFTGGFTDEVEGEAIGGEVVVEERETVQVSTVREPNEPEYAEPSGQE